MIKIDELSIPTGTGLIATSQVENELIKDT